MENYIILKTQGNTFPFVCLITSMDDVYFLIDDIKEDMKKQRIETILVDLFLTNGFSYNRFFEINLSNNDENIINPRYVTDEVLFAVNKYLNDNRYLLKSSALSQALINIVYKQLDKLQLR